MLGLALALTLPLLPDVARCADPTIYLSWHAPYGTPGATDTLMAPCGGARKDTLYLTFKAGRSTGGYFGIDGILLFHAPVRDTLSAQWWFEQQNLQVQFASDSIPGITRAWVQPLSTMTTYLDHTSGSARLRLMNVRPTMFPVWVRDSVQYFFCRIFVPRPSAGMLRCDQPLCIEWTQSEVYLDTTTTTSTMATRTGSRRFVSWNSPNGKVCADYRDDLQPPAVDPKVSKAAPGKGKKSQRKP